MSEEEAACLSGYTGQYISDPHWPTTAPSLCGLPPEVKGDKWKEDAESPHEDYLTRKSFLLCACFSLL